MENKMRVGVKYWNELGDAMYVQKMQKDGTIYASTKPKNYRPFSLKRATEIQASLESEGIKCIKVYQQ